MLEPFAWSVVAGRVPVGVWSGWAARLPELAGLDTAAVQGLFEPRSGVDRDRQDVVLRALLGLAGAGETAAGWLVAAIMCPAAGGVARELSRCGYDLGVVPGALWEAVTTFRPGPGCRAVAAGLRWRIRRLALRDARAGAVSRGPDAAVVGVVCDLEGVPEGVEGPERVAAAFWELLGWAAGAGVVTAEQVELVGELIATEIAVEVEVEPGSAWARSVAATSRVAAGRGWSQRMTVRRRADAVAQLRRATAAYLAAA